MLFRSNVYEKGIIEVTEGVFTKTYYLEDINFKIAPQQVQEDIFMLYGDLLNSFSNDIGIEITINNRNIDEEMFCKDTLINKANDNLNIYREEYNEMLRGKMTEGRNNISHEKYLTISVPCESIDEATIQFSRIDVEVETAVKRMTKNAVNFLSTEERLNILFDIYNLDNEIGRAHV